MEGSLISTATVGEFDAWLANSVRGQHFVYAHTAAGECLMAWIRHLNAAGAIKTAVWRQAMRGTVTLVQRRTSFGGCDYIAIRGRFTPPLDRHVEYARKPEFDHRVSA